MIFYLVAKTLLMNYPKFILCFQHNWLLEEKRKPEKYCNFEYTILQKYLQPSLRDFFSINTK